MSFCREESLHQTISVDCDMDQHIVSTVDQLLIDCITLCWCLPRFFSLYGILELCLAAAEQVLPLDQHSNQWGTDEAIYR